MVLWFRLIQGSCSQGEFQCRMAAMRSFRCGCVSDGINCVFVIPGLEVIGRWQYVLCSKYGVPRQHVVVSISSSYINSGRHEQSGVIVRGSSQLTVHASQRFSWDGWHGIPEGVLAAVMVDTYGWTKAYLQLLSTGVRRRKVRRRPPGTSDD